MLKRFVTYFVFALTLCSLRVPTVDAQGYLTQVGKTPFQATFPVELGYYDASTGNLHIEIPLGSWPQRGSHSFSASLVYDSRIWFVGVPGGTKTWQPSNVPVINWAGWRLVTIPALGGSTNYNSQQFSCFCEEPPCHNTPKYTKYSNFTWIDAYGTVRTFPINTEYDPHLCDSDQSSDIESANDSSGYIMSVTNYTQISSIKSPDGTTVYPGFEDTNGNFFSVDSGGNVVDTLGRTPVKVTANCNGNSTKICYDILNSQGSTSRYTVTTETISVHTNFGQPGVTEYSGSLTAIQSVTLPDNTSYSFTYDSGTTSGYFGTLATMTLPTLGQITYTFTTYPDAFGNRNRWLASRRTPDGYWSYIPSVLSSCPPGWTFCQQVQVAKPSGDNTVYQFGSTSGNIGSWATSILYYTGAISSANQIMALFQTWSSGPTNVQKLTQTQNNNLGFNNTVQYTYLRTIGPWISKISEWKYYSGTLPSSPDRITTFTGYCGISPTGATITNGAGTQTIAQTNITYDNYGSNGLTLVTGTTQHDDANYGTGFTTRCNPTSVSKLVSGSNYLNTSMTYDTTGQVRSVTDSAQNTTNLTYADSFYTDNGANPPSIYSPSTPTNAYLTQMSLPIIGAASIGYYFNTGKRAVTTDQNQTSVYFHNIDPFDRPTNINFPIGWTMTSYPSSTELDSYIGINTTTPSTNCSSCRQDQIKLDTMARSLSNIQKSDPDGATEVDFTYDSSGRTHSTTNPYRVSSTGSETISYDGIDRPTQLTRSDSNSLNLYYGAAVGGSGLGGVTTQYCAAATYGQGYPTLAIDEATKKHESWADGFGRTIEVDEPDASGNLTSATCYIYDLNDNLTQIVHGTQIRTYQYDLLSRLTSASIPETGNVASTFSYTLTSGIPCSGNPSAICQTTDPRGVTTTYTYDQLNRLTRKTYSDSTPTAMFTFDQGSYGKSRLTAMTDGAGSASWTFDADGRILSEQRTLAGITKTISYSYALDGSLTSITYPSTHAVTYNVGNAERPISLVDSTGSINYVGPITSQPLYAPTGGLANVLLGQVGGGFAGITHSFTYNSRLQVNTIQATSANGTPLNMSYCFYQLQGGSCPTQSSGNNGDVTGIVNNLDSNRTETVTYDPLDRVLTAQSQATSGNECWGQSFGVDALANLFSETVTKCTAPSLNLSINGFNQITNTGFSYDAAGNMTSDGQYTYNYDAEGRTSLASGMTGGPYCYTYDGNGLRVLKSNANGGSCTQAAVDVIYWRDIWGNTIAETDSSGSTTNSNYHEYAFFAGRRVARRDGPGSVYYYLADQLGSTRAITDSNGNKCYDTDYFPDGAEVGPFTNTCSDHYKFTGYERDSETGLDYALARYYNSRTGRFMSPDTLDGSTSAPQSLNRYAYVQNNCMNLVDPFGLDCGVIIGGGSQTPNTPNTVQQQKLANDASTVQAFPYSNISLQDTENDFLAQGHGAETAATKVAENAIMFAAQQQTGPINVVTFSAGASAYLSALPHLPSNVVSRIQNVVYLSPVSPGFPLANGKGTGQTTAYYGNGAREDYLKGVYLTNTNGVTVKSVDCKHDANCEVSALQAQLKLALGYPCANSMLFRRGGGGGGGSGPLFYFTFYTACSEGGCSSVITGGIWIWPLPAPRATK